MSISFSPLQQTQDPVLRLQTQRQQLQDQLLLLRSTGTDAAIPSDEVQGVLQDKLDEVSSQLRSAKAEAAAFDRYEPAVPLPSPGLYEARRTQGGWHVSFSPYQPE
ncbi:MAG: hypothetical protein HFF30_09915 [Flavonifractor sp.]|jgi:hypothetical protein|nr:hypothetical protein [Flavonifractor sp.]